ncbi:MAG: cytochrome C oxidase subunit IV family protein [Candidatus Rokubacteria bacterium]|nr:cytochrome C oxidase subunit IV family protein [Candidatus Rokubacteria bacterium]MBI2527190.1 cytochrome C oxidase subunit IV family protein [Candidatus Rokubacteria bacterium]MBI3104496.1 cytochrome C oxidase subunit IV family protein [Candidatus Rokubacteria bacterium]
MADAHPHTALHAEGTHAPVATYLRVAVVLAIITAIEIAALYVPGLPTAALVTALIVFSVLKFGLVVAFFMHLRYDSRVLAALFFGPLMIACAIILALMALFSAFLILPRA